jgi:6-phosphogluconolactonase
MQMKQYFMLGSYTEPILFGTGEVFNGKGKGLSICSLENGEIEIISEISIRNPSFLCIDEIKQKIYTVNEMKEYLGLEGGGLTQLSYTDEFSMILEGTWNVGGKDPCHIALSPEKKILAIANFASGSVTSFPVDDLGNVLGEKMKLFQHTGSSSHPVRQKGPHAHSCIFNKNSSLLFVPDLGLDKVVTYEYDSGNLKENKSLEVSVPSGSGPRYGEFSIDGKNFYLINEISSQVMFLSYEEGRFYTRQTVNTLPDNFDGDNICSDLHLTPKGDYLYASNRGHDSIACYKVYDDGSLDFIERQSCGGRTPRNFAIAPDGKYLIVGNQDSDNICVFEIEENGHLTIKSQINTGSPVCIRFFGAS